MKKTIIIFASTLLSFATVAQKANPKTTTPKTTNAKEIKPDLYVTAKSGLKLRETPSLTGKPLATAAQGSKVQWLSTDYKNKVKVEGKEGFLAKVLFEGKTGFMFDGFLAINSPLAPLVITKPTVIIKNVDEMHLAQMVGTMKQEDLAEVGSDIGYYTGIAVDALKKYKIPFQQTTLRFIQFVKKDGSKELIDTGADGWREFDCLYFNGTTIKKGNTTDLMSEEGKKPETLNFMNK